jgi:hypothetical protein
VAESGAAGDRHGPFACSQFEFGFPLGPADGRYLVRREPDGAPRRIVVVSTLEGECTPGRRRGRLRRRRRASAGAAAEPARPPLARVTVIDADPFTDANAASEWLGRLRRDRDALAAAAADGLVEVNRLLRAQRAAAHDPYVREVGPRAVLRRRVGYGDGAALADGHPAEALELPPPPARRTRRRERAGPRERLAALLGARAPLLASEELVLRARLDLDAGRPREAALQARAGLETMLSELGDDAGAAVSLAAVRERSEAVAAAAVAAIAGDPDEEQQAAVAGAVERMEAALARRRVG